MNFLIGIGVNFLKEKGEEEFKLFLPLGFKLERD
jgi:hypothetical protein